MSKINIKGVELEINMLDADTAETVENALLRVKEKASEIQADKSLKWSNGIRAICHEIFDCFNAIFGDGTDTLIFGGRTDMGECMEAFAELSRQTVESGMRTVQGISSKYAPNREARRRKT